MNSSAREKIPQRWKVHCLYGLALLIFLAAHDANTQVVRAQNKTLHGVQPYITVNFPTSSVGEYQLLKPGKLYSDDLPKSGLKPAKGPANIPASYKLALTLNYFGSTNIQLLKSIPVPLLRSLALANMEVDNGTFQQLLHFTDLVSLDISGTDVNDSGTKGLRNLAKLQKLDIGFCPIGISTIEEISNLKDLLRLQFASSTLGEKAMPPLVKLKQLKVLVLSTTRMTDSCVSQISKLSELEELGLAHNNITDQCIDSILKLKHLRRINLADTKVTFSGLMKLNALPALKYLLLRKNTLSSEQLAKLQARLPKVILEEGTRAKDYDPELFGPIH